MIHCYLHEKIHMVYFMWFFTHDSFILRWESLHTINFSQMWFFTHDSFILRCYFLLMINFFSHKKFTGFRILFFFLLNKGHWFLSTSLNPKIDSWLTRQKNFIRYGCDLREMGVYLGVLIGSEEIKPWNIGLPLIRPLSFHNAVRQDIVHTGAWNCTYWPKHNLWIIMQAI